MKPPRSAKLSGSKLAFAHRWADALVDSLGGHLLLMYPGLNPDTNWECFLQLSRPPRPELSDSEINDLASRIAKIAHAGKNEEAIGVVEYHPSQEVTSPQLINWAFQDWQCFVGNTGRSGFHFVALLPPDLRSNARHVQQLAIAHWNAQQSLEESLNIKVQNRALVQQVTQDFEELTWLRGVSQQIGEADIRDPMLNVATSQLPMLRNVIKSELIALIPAELVEDPSLKQSHRITSTGTPPCEWDRILEFVKRCTERSAAPTLVFNIQSVANLFEPFPEIRNCIVARVEKNGRRFGYLVAINREMDFLGQSPEDFVNLDPNGIQFGTFEAGLLIVLAAVLSSHATNGELFREQENLLMGVVRAVINAIDAKDTYTFGHSDRVATYAKSIASLMGLDKVECDRIYLSGLLHDVGKIGVPDYILGKPGKLTQEEFDIVKKHPEIGYQILKHLEPLKDVLPGVLHHHEAINGTGYPKGLAGDAIPLQGRILAVADAYDAMTSDRPYREGMPSSQAEEILRKDAGVIWDELAVFALLQCIKKGEIEPHIANSNYNPLSQAISYHTSNSFSAHNFPAPAQFTRVKLEACRFEFTRSKHTVPGLQNSTGTPQCIAMPVIYPAPDDTRASLFAKNLSDRMPEN